MSKSRVGVGGSWRGRCYGEQRRYGKRGRCCSSFPNDVAQCIWVDYYLLLGRVHLLVAQDDNNAPFARVSFSTRECLRASLRHARVEKGLTISSLGARRKKTTRTRGPQLSREGTMSCHSIEQRRRLVVALVSKTNGTRRVGVAASTKETCEHRHDQIVNHYLVVPVFACFVPSLMMPVFAPMEQNLRLCLRAIVLHMEEEELLSPC